jgi:alginate biosynthesis protein Alg44
MGAIESAFIREKADREAKESAFIHEAEVQRQHARHRIPVKVVLRDNVFRTTDWSLGGIGIDLSGVDWETEFGEGPRVGDLMPLELLFEFVGFTFSLTVTGEIRNWQSTTQRTAPAAPSVKSHVPLLSFGKAEEPDAVQRLGLQFIDLTPQQLAFLRFLLDAYIAGELVEAADLLEVAARVQPAAPRALPKRPLPASAAGRVLHVGKRAAIWAVVGLASVFLVGTVSASVYKKLFVIPAQSAFVTADVMVMTAPTAGMLTSLLPAGQDTVARGSPIAGIQNDSTSGVTLESPCNCRVVARKARSGMYIKQGETLLVLAPDTAKPYALARLTPGEALALKNGTPVRVGLGNGAAATPGTIREIRRHESLWTGDQRDPDLWAPVEVVIEFGGELPLSTIGAPLAVEFDVFDDSRLGRLLRAWPGALKGREAAAQTGSGSAG